MPFAASTLLAALLAVAGAAPTAAPETLVLSLRPEASSLTYTVVHTLHTVVGTSHKAEGKVALLPDGRLQVAVRAPIASFDSENSNRDEHMQETLEATKYPLVSFKGATKLARPDTFPTTVKLEVVGELDFHGVKRPEAIAVEVTFTSPTEATAKSRFMLSLDAYHVERPSLLLVKIDDGCQIDMDLALARK